MSATKRYIHARLDPDTRARLEELKKRTGLTESALVRRGLQLVAQETRASATALDLAGDSVGCFKDGPADDLSHNRRHLDGFGE